HSERKLRVPLYEGEHPRPGVLGCLGELLVAPVEEAVRCAVVADQLVLDTGPRECLVERLVVGRRDVSVGAGLQSQNRCLDLVRTARGPGRSVLGVTGPAVEADRAG